MARGRVMNSESGHSPPNPDYEAIVARVRDEMKNEMEEKIAAINKENDEKMAKLLADFEAQLKRNMQSESHSEYSRAEDKTDQSHPHPEDLSIERVFKSIDRHRPKNFGAAYAPTEAKHWIERLEAIFAAVVCTSYQKARVAILLLEGDALSWWKSVSGDDSMTTWEMFKEKFM